MKSYTKNQVRDLADSDLLVRVADLPADLAASCVPHVTPPRPCPQCEGKGAIRMAGHLLLCFRCAGWGRE